MQPVRKESITQRGAVHFTCSQVSAFLEGLMETTNIFVKSFCVSAVFQGERAVIDLTCR